MSVSIRSPRFSFVRFGSPADNYNTCSDSRVQFCLPVFGADDIAFQFIALATTAAEADGLCADNLVKVGLVRDCEQEGFDIDFDTLYDLQPEKIRISDLEVLYNWPYGFPGFSLLYAVDDCFYVRVVIDHPDLGEITACSNCFQRIAEDCYTSVVEYGADENQFGFNYCGGGGGVFEEEEVQPCPQPTIITFTDVDTLSIPYTPGMQALYGDVPTVEIWMLDGGEYVQAIIRAGFDAYPPTMIIADLGGTATGFVKIS